MSNSLILLMLCLPLLGGMIGYFSTFRSSLLSLVSTFGSFAIATVSLFRIDADYLVAWSWLVDLEFSVQLDRISLLLIALVTFISILVQVFSLEYMREEPGIKRYYFKLGFFVSSMIGLLLADNLLLLFVFWELVGLASYLLIGFWYAKGGIPSSARTSFMVNRFADAALLAGIILVFDDKEVLSIQSLTGELSFMASLLLAVGAFGKSAQLPFSGWLVKAMVGPTPVSALIHAATMVAAGVYLLYRVAPILDTDVLLIVAIVGSVTAFYAAICAIFQFDIKKVLAYSTISQLGYMTLGIGVGARVASMFHLFTHAFFKAGLFLGAASIIHYLHKTTKKDAQDMRFMGGLSNALPWTFRAFLVCGLALAGIPLFSGFMSKDGIILGAWNFATEYGGWTYLIPDVALITAAMTAFYVGRMILLVFTGEERSQLSGRSAEAKSLSIPLVILGVCSVWILHHWNPLAHHALLFEWLGIKNQVVEGGDLIPFLSIILVVSGSVLAYSFFKPGTAYTQNFMEMESPASKAGALVFNGLGLTWLYDKLGKWVVTFSAVLLAIDQKIIDVLVHAVAVGSVVFSKVLALTDRFVVDGPVNWTAAIARFVGKRLGGLSSKDGQTQLAWLLILVILILIWFVFF